MTNSETEHPWWAYSKREQKDQLEDATDWYLSQKSELTDRQKMLLHDAIGHPCRGLFGIAVQDIYELSLPESAWSPSARVEPMMVESITREALRRSLDVLRSAPVQNRPIFG